MAKPRRSRRTLTTIAVLVLVSVSIITVGQRGGSRIASGLRSAANSVFSPIRSGFDDLTRPVANFFAGAVDYGSVAQQNAELRHELGQLRQEQSQQSYAERQLRQITALEHLPYLASLPTVTAQTTLVGVSNFVASIQIDKGTADGVGLGMPVVGAGGLVGQVVEVYHHGAVVRLVTDGRFKVGVAFGVKNQHLATAEGQGPGDPLAASFIGPGTPLHRGQVMFTNGLGGGEYPGGIPVGRVTSFATPPGASQMDVSLAPTADLSELAYVDVVLWEPTP